MDCSMEIAGGKPYRLRALLFDNPSPDGSDTTAYINALKPERLWPLAIGKKIEADFSSGGKNWHYILSVARYEKRTGPGDAMIDTFLIEMQEQGPAGQRSVSRWWISPADKFAIRYDLQRRQPRQPRRRDQRHALTQRLSIISRRFSGHTVASVCDRSSSDHQRCSTMTSRSRSVQSSRDRALSLTRTTK